MYAVSPAAAALAATLLARFPVLAQPTVVKPNSFALDKATATTRSLKESDGQLTASFFTHSRLRPSASPNRAARTRGVPPTLRPTVGAPASGSNSRYRHMVKGRRASSALV